MKQCKICGGKHYAKYLCRKHYHQLPEVKTQEQEYKQRPEVKARELENERIRRKRPDVKAKIQEYSQHPEVRARRLEIQQRPENRIKQHKYSQRPDVKRKKKTYNKAYSQRPEARKKIKINKKEYYQQHYDEIKVYCQHPEVKKRRRKNAKKYHQNPKNKEKIQKWGRERRARKNNIVHDFTQEEWRAKLKATNGICPGYNKESHYVGIKNLTLDHNPPINRVTKGFIYTINDIGPFCKSCNCTKKDRIGRPVKTTISNFAQYKPF